MPTIITTWHKNPLAGIPYSSEGELQNLLEKHPQLLPVREINPEALFCVIAGAEVETGAGPIDLVAIDDKAQIYLIENKLVENPESRRSAIAQLLEYASRNSGDSLLNCDQNRGRTTITGTGARK